jgi:hypothetical protein
VEVKMIMCVTIISQVRLLKEQFDGQKKKTKAPKEKETFVPRVVKHSDEDKENYSQNPTSFGTGVQFS